MLFTVEILIFADNYANFSFLFHTALRYRECLATMISMVILASMWVVCLRELVLVTWKESSAVMEGKFCFFTLLGILISFKSVEIGNSCIQFRALTNIGFFSDILGKA